MTLWATKLSEQDINTLTPFLPRSQGFRPVPSLPFVLLTKKLSAIKTLGSLVPFKIELYISSKKLQAFSNFRYLKKVVLGIPKISDSEVILAPESSTWNNALKNISKSTVTGLPARLEWDWEIISFNRSINAKAWFHSFENCFGWSISFQMTFEHSPLCFWRSCYLKLRTYNRNITIFYGYNLTINNYGPLS